MQLAWQQACIEDDISSTPRGGEWNLTMRKIDELNPLARRIARALLLAFPQFRRHLEVIHKGHWGRVIGVTSSLFTM